MMIKFFNFAKKPQFWLLIQMDVTNLCMCHRKN